jgi:hypothetical protein
MQALLCFVRHGIEPASGAGWLRRGVTWGVINFAAAAVVAFGLPLLVPEAWLGKNAAENQFASGRYAYILFVAVVWAPLFETLAGQLAPIALCRKLRVPHRWSILLCGAHFGCWHFVNGGLLHGASTFAAGCVLAEAYWRNRTVSVGRAYAVTATAHAFSNALVVLATAILPA